MSLTVIASNSQEAALLAAFRNMTDGDKRRTVSCAKAVAIKNPRTKQARKSHLHLIAGRAKS